MNPFAWRKSLPWLGIGLVAGTVIVGVLALVRSPADIPIAEVREGTPELALSRPGTSDADQVLRDRLELFDPTPLFLPTDKNSGYRALPEGLMAEPGATVAALFPARWTFGSETLRIVFPASISQLERPEEGLRIGERKERNWGFGAVDHEVAKLPQRLAFVEAISIRSGAVAIAEVLRGEGPAEIEDWAPVELLLAVEASGLVGKLVVTASSGSEAVDNFFCKYLADSWRIGERLPPGFYRLIVGP